MILSKISCKKLIINYLWCFAFIIYCVFIFSALTDGEVNGYFIAKGTLLMSNLWAIHHDPEYWGADAEEFRPERFLTENGQVKKWERFIPFSIGNEIPSLIYHFFFLNLRRKLLIYFFINIVGSLLLCLFYYLFLFI